ncbi:hypothetical protein GSI_09023 [Ganoderma sinense ZZ0214-1]|uniref:DUF6589 domain-containing protein n=1 Tax=Ganoderma sinense ZZ0214-1 TaxID=1077348 RepID=A0A2G8S5B4_9APHY|nr:hypothetical protein GSI_09023 [Ganoderma sinense ZZ0214-1]
MLGLYLYATGAQRQLISILSNLGLSSSYTSIAGGRNAALDDVPAPKDAPPKDTEQDEDEEDEDDPDWLPDEDDASDVDWETDDELGEPEESDVEGEDPEPNAATAGSTMQEFPERGQTDEQVSSHENERPPNAIADPVEGAEEEAPTVFSLLSRGAGLLRRVSTVCRSATRSCAQSRLCGHVYDNINMMFRIAEQILGRKDSQENGTCATIFPLYDAKPEDMQTSQLLDSIDKAPPLTVLDILHTPAEAHLFTASLRHTLLRTIVASSDLFARFRTDVDSHLPATDDQIPLRRTEVYPLPAMHIDESSTAGNGEVVDAIFKELGFDIGTTRFSGITRPIFGDQLSIARLRTIIMDRAGHEPIGDSYAWAVFGPGFFHHQMALVHGIMETHWGDSTAGTRNPSSLSFFNTIIDRKPIVMSSLPPYRVCRDLIFDTLSACALHCLELVSGKTIEQYAEKATFEQLSAHVDQIFDTYATPHTVHGLRDARHAIVAERMRAFAARPPSNPPKPPPDPLTDPIPHGDMIYENATLFLRDALILREFTDSIKGGYSGRIIRVLKILALMYRGCGRTKYAHELLHLVHNLTHVWPKPLRAIMINNWLVNPTGKPNAWVPVDLLQEHMNFWIKVMYKANGSNASWEWLAMISPCVALLRKLAEQMNSTLGAQLGTKHHTPERRVLRGVKDAEVPNVVAAGLKQLQKPLAEYNKTFQQLQQRRRELPLTDPTISATPSASISNTTAAPATSDTRLYATSFPSTTNVAEPREVEAPVNGLEGIAPGEGQADQDDADADDEDEDAQYWQAFDEEYDARGVFAAEEEPSFDIHDYI